ncbi:MAG TPA: heme peroxidase family protein [Sphingomicrobium sp.]|nr:heme peroxidase family protein [Sphingomicrobium sp.]
MEKFTVEARDKAIEKILRTRRDLPKIDREKLQHARALRPTFKRYHGVKVPIAWFPWWRWRTPCSDKFGYLTPKAVRSATKLPFDAPTQALLQQLGDLMADPSRGAGLNSAIPAGYTYFGQFVDHDITLDISSTLDAEVDATKINNMRSPSLDLDALYGSGPALDPFLYEFPTSGPPTAIKMLLGTNQNVGPGGPGTAGGSGPMGVPTNSDLPRASTNTALIGDPRNDENLIVSQFHHAMLKFHNQVVDGLVAAGFSGDIFLEAKRIVTHHYQWAVVEDFLKRICGSAAVSAAMASVSAAKGSPFAMPVEFAVAAYRFGHSMIRERYWVNAAQINAPLSDVFAFARNPLLPVFSNWVVDFNAFFDTGFFAAVNNKATKIDSVLAPGLDVLPGFTGMMAMLATRNLLRGLALGLPSGQGLAGHFGIAAMTAAQLKQGLPAGEAALLDSNGGILLSKTPLWYYVLREAAVIGNGEQLGPVGGRVVAETFVRMLKRDADSFLNTPAPFTPSLPSAVAGQFTVADLVNFARVTIA